MTEDMRQWWLDMLAGKYGDGPRIPLGCATCGAPFDSPRLFFVHMAEHHPDFCEEMLEVLHDIRQQLGWTL
jgi:hypothetical protein